MNISILCSDPQHPVMSRLGAWRDAQRVRHEVEIFQQRSELRGGDILFLISCAELVGPDTRGLYRNTLVIHASDLPRGRGWSPHVWQVLEGKKEITVSMIEAVDAVDAGPIWKQETIRLTGHELFDEICGALFDAEIRLMDWALEHVPGGTPVSQREEKATYYRKRTPEDSRLDPAKSIAEQFDLLRVCDPLRYPAFFELRGKKYALQLRKMDQST